MSRRNPVRGRRRPVQPGDRVVYMLAPGPPAEAVAAYGGDVQAAITAGLTLLALALRGSIAPVGTPAPAQPSDTMAAVTLQDFFAGT